MERQESVPLYIRVVATSCGKRFAWGPSADEPHEFMAAHLTAPRHCQGELFQHMRRGRRVDGGEIRWFGNLGSAPTFVWTRRITLLGTRLDVADYEIGDEIWIEGIKTPDLEPTLDFAYRYWFALVLQDPTRDGFYTKPEERAAP